MIFEGGYLKSIWIWFHLFFFLIIGINRINWWFLLLLIYCIIWVFSHTLVRHLNLSIAYCYLQQFRWLASPNYPINFRIFAWCCEKNYFWYYSKLSYTFNLCKIECDCLCWGYFEHRSWLAQWPRNKRLWLIRKFYDF